MFVFTRNPPTCVHQAWHTALWTPNSIAAPWILQSAGETTSWTQGPHNGMTHLMYWLELHFNLRDSRGGSVPAPPASPRRLIQSDRATRHRSTSRNIVCVVILRQASGQPQLEVQVTRPSQVLRRAPPGPTTMSCLPRRPAGSPNDCAADPRLQPLAALPSHRRHPRRGPRTAPTLALQVTPSKLPTLCRTDPSAALPR